ncbi:MAG: peptidoglycan editing factor PgeF [Mycobacteriales bacterium]
MLAHDETVHGARLVFTDRLCGVSAPPYQGLNLALHTDDDWDRVHANRDLLGRALQLSYRDLVFGQQVHGRGVRRVSARSARGCDRGLPQTDGLVTSTRGVAIVMMGADCLPVLLAGNGVVGAAHVGRAGLALRVVDEVLAAMRAEGADVVAARIGPGICGRCYEVPEQMAAASERAAPGSRATTRQLRPSIDLVAGVRRQLQDAGVVDVAAVGGCTFEQPDRFFSYRRDGLTGRHAGVAVLP